VVEWKNGFGREFRNRTQISEGNRKVTREGTGGGGGGEGRGEEEEEEEEEEG